MHKTMVAPLSREIAKNQQKAQYFQGLLLRTRSFGGFLDVTMQCDKIYLA
jgi:hypothetical protein